MPRTVTALSVLALAASPALADFASDFGVGRDLAGNIVTEFNFGAIEPLPPSPDPLVFDGWIGDEPGFASFPENEPGEGIFRLEPGAEIRFELISADPGFEVYDLVFGGPLAPGSGFNFDAITGNPADENTWSNFDDHPFWTVNKDNPGYNPGDTEWDVTFRLLDVGSTGYTQTDPITVTFTIPAPGGVAAFAALGLGATRRRR